MKYCAVRSCPSRSGGASGISFHKIPPGKSVRQKWLNVMGNPEYASADPNKYTCIYVCGNHFKKRDYIPCKKKSERGRRLKKDAIPSLNLPATSNEQGVGGKQLPTASTGIDTTSAGGLRIIMETDDPMEGTSSKVSHHPSPSTTTKHHDSSDSDFADLGHSMCLSDKHSMLKTGTQGISHELILHTVSDSSHSSDSDFVKVKSRRTSYSSDKSMACSKMGTRKRSLQHTAESSHSSDSDFKGLKPSVSRKVQERVSKESSGVRLKPRKIHLTLQSSASKYVTAEHHASDISMTSLSTIEPEENAILYDPQSSFVESSYPQSEEAQNSQACSERSTILAFEHLICEAFGKCELCFSNTNVTTDYKGTHMYLNISCSSPPCGHTKNWSSSPEIRRMSVMNLITVGATFYSGATYTDIADFFKLMKTRYISERRFYEIQSQFIFPTIHNYYFEKLGEVLEEIKARNIPVTLMGDGRSDSPGFSAKYMVYSFMEEKTEKIINIQLVQKTECSSSVAMEKLAFERAMETLLSHDIKIDTIVTDRAPSIRKLMREQHPSVNHQFDIWHVCKGLKKKLVSAGNKKGMEDLLLWTRSITNHLWWCCQHCGGDPMVLKKKWLSLLHHITDTHEWNNDGEMQRCNHADLPREQRLKTKWLERGSPCFNALKKLVENNYLLRDLEQMTLFKHTGSLEVYHNVILKFAPKRLHFSYDGMLARCELAVLDHNENVGRYRAVTQKGVLKYKRVYSRTAKQWIVKNMYGKKTNMYASDLLQRTVANRDNEDFCGDFPRTTHPASIAPIPAPSKEELVAKKRKTE